MNGKILEGITHVCGEHDTGKTTFALECGADPKKILFLDDDVKGRATVADLKAQGVELGGYIDLVEMSRRMNELAFHNKVAKLISEIKPGQYDALIWDTWSGFSGTCHSYVMANLAEFRQNWSPMGTIKGAQQWQEARKYEAYLLNYMAQRVKTVILVTHLKDYYAGKVKVPGKYVPASSPVLERVPRFRIWLRQNPSGRPVPIGLVLKRLDKKTFVAGEGIRTVSVLPRKIVPSAEENSLWDTIWRYWHEPVGDRELFDEELPDEYEISILEGTLTKDQARTFRLLVESGMLEEPQIEQEGVPEEVQMQVWELSSGGMLPPQIAKETGLSIPVVLRLIKEKPVEEAA